MSEVSVARLASSSRRRNIEFTIHLRLGNSSNVLEHVALGKHIAALTDLESVAGVVVPVVVDSVQNGVALDLGRAAGSVVDVVSFHGDQVVAAVEVDAPVVVGVAGGGVVGHAVDVVVGQGNAVGRRGAEDVVLAADLGGGYVVDPDEVGVVDGDGVTSPDVLRVDVGDLDVSSCMSARCSGLKGGSGGLGDSGAYWMMMLLAPETIRRPLPLMIPEDPSPRMVLSEATVIPRVPALSLSPS